MSDASSSVDQSSMFDFASFSHSAVRQQRLTVYCKIVDQFYWGGFFWPSINRFSSSNLFLPHNNYQDARAKKNEVKSPSGTCPKNS